MKNNYFLFIGEYLGLNEYFYWYRNIFIGKNLGVFFHRGVVAYLAHPLSQHCQPTGPNSSLWSSSTHFWNIYNFGRQNTFWLRPFNQNPQSFTC